MKSKKPNYILHQVTNNPNLSYGAIGLFHSLFNTYQKNEEIQMQEVIDKSPDNKKTVLAALKELVTNNYVIIVNREPRRIMSSPKIICKISPTLYDIIK